jgi:hypothetical protein
MIAGKRLQKQTSELFTDGPAQAKRGRGLLVLVLIQAGTVLEDHRRCTGFGSAAFMIRVIGARHSPEDPSRE